MAINGDYDKICQPNNKELSVYCACLFIFCSYFLLCFLCFLSEFLSSWFFVVPGLAPHMSLWVCFFIISLLTNIHISSLLHYMLSLLVNIFSHCCIRYYFTPSNHNMNFRAGLQKQLVEAEQKVQKGSLYWFKYLLVLAAANCTFLFTPI